MTLLFRDRLKETTTSTGTADFSLNGAVSSSRPFSDLGTGNQVFYTAQNLPNNEWEVGLGTYTTGTPNILSRTTVLANSLGTTAKISFTASPTVWGDVPAALIAAIINPNKIINGGMVLDQRNAGASLTIVAQQYTLDRFWAASSVASKYSVQQKSDGPIGNPNYLRVTSLSAYTVGATETFHIEQAIEGLNVKDLGFGAAGAKSITIGILVRSSLTGQFGGSICNGTAARFYPFSFTINNANTWEWKFVTIPGDTTGTWATDNTTGINVNIDLGSGSSRLAAAGSWTASTARGATGDTSVVGTNAATFDFTALKLEAGSVPTPYVEDDFAVLVQKCQRYYEKSYSLSVVPGTITSPGAGCASFMLYSMPSGAYINIHIGAMFAVRKRGVPTVTAYSPQTGTAGKFRDNPNSVDVTANIDTIGETSARMYGGMGTAQASIDMWAHWTAEAEL